MYICTLLTAVVSVQLYTPAPASLCHYQLIISVKGRPPVREGGSVGDADSLIIWYDIDISDEDKDDACSEVFGDNNVGTDWKYGRLVSFSF